MKLVNRSTQAQAQTVRPAQALPKWMFAPVERPSFTDSLKFPEDITKLPPAEVGKYLGQYTSLHAFAISELAKADIVMLRIRSEIDWKKRNLQRHGASQNWNKYVTDRQIRLDMSVSMLERKANEQEEQLIVLRSYVEIFDRYMNTLSREMTRRTSELQKVR